MNNIVPGFTQASLNYNSSLDLDELLPLFDGYRVDPNTITPERHHTIIDPSRVLHWQYYPYSRIYMSRNFNYNYPEKTQLIVDYVLELQEYYRKHPCEHYLVDLLLNHTVERSNVLLIWIPFRRGDVVLPHRDYRRGAINIGLRNSDAGTTIVSTNNKLDNWDNDVKHEYTQTDGSVYILDGHRAHSVRSNVIDGTVDRYIISYNLP